MANGSAGELIFDTKIDQSGFKRDANTIKSQAELLKDSTQKLGKVMAKSFSEPSSRVMDLNGKIAQTQKEIAQLQAELQQLDNTQFKSDEFITMEKQVERAQQKLLLLLNTREALEERLKADLPQGMEMGDSDLQRMYANNAEWKKMTKSIDAADMSLTSYERKLDEIRVTDSKGSNAQTKSYQTKAGKLEKLINKLNTYEKKLDETTAKENKMATSTKRSGQAAEKSSKQYSSMGRQLKMMLGQMLLVSLLFSAITAIKDGMQNLSQYSDTYNTAISGLVSSLAYLKNSLTTAFAPIIEFASPYLQMLIDKLASALNWIAQFTAALLGTSQKVTTAVKVNKNYAESLDKTAESAEKANKSLASFDTVNVLSDTKSKSSKSDTGESVSTMFTTTEIDESASSLANRIKKLFEPLKDISLDNLNSSLERLKTAVEPLKEKLFEGLKWAFDNLFVPLAAWTIEDALPAFIDVLSGCLSVLNSVLEALKPLGIWLWESFLKPIATWTGGVIVSVLEGLAGALEKISGWIDEHQGIVQTFIIILGSFAAAWGIVSLALKICTITSAVATAVMGGLSAAIGFITSPIGFAVLAIGALIAIGVLLWKNWDWIKEKAIEVWASIKEAFFNAINPIINSTFVQDIKSMFNGILAFIKGVFTGDWNSAWEGLKQSFKGYINAMIDILNGFVGRYVDAINVLIGAISKIKINVPDVDLFGKYAGTSIGFKINPIDFKGIPRLATGAVIPPNSEFLAMLGDQKRGVNIETPLETMIQAFKTALNSGNYGRVSITIPVVLDGKKIYDTVVEYNNGEVKQTGRSKLRT